MCRLPVTFGGGITMEGGGGGALGPAGPKGARVFPMLSDAPLDFGGVERLVHCDALEVS